MNISYYIARRYLFSPGSSNAINIITGIAAGGVVIGAMALFVVLCGFAGLKDFSLQFSSYFDPDLKVFPSSGKTFTISAEQKEALQNINGIAAFSEIVEERVIVEFKNKQKTAVVKGVDETYPEVVKTDSIITYGNWLTDSDVHVVVGRQISNELGIGVADYQNFVILNVVKPGKGIPTKPSQALRKKATVNVGMYAVSEDLDKKYIFSTIAAARDLLQLPENTVSNLELKLTPEADQQKIAARINEIFNSKVTVKNRAQLNDKLYKMLNTENLISYLVITLIAIIAIFNVAGAIIMMIIDKKGNIKTLHNIGSTVADIRRVFLFQGSLMTILGTIVGLFLGFLLILAQQQFDLLMITPALPYPTRITAISFVIVFLTITVIGVIASMLSSSRINKELVAST